MANKTKSLVKQNKLPSTSPSKIDEMMSEKMLYDWINNNKSLVQLSKDYDVTYEQVLVAKDKFTWVQRRESIHQKLRAKHEKEILKVKGEIFKTTKQLVTVASRKVKEFYKNKKDGVIIDDDGQLILTDAFVKNARDWKTVIETFYLLLNDGVEKKEIDVGVSHHLKLSDKTAAKMLEMLASEQDGEVIETEAVEVEKE